LFIRKKMNEKMNISQLVQQCAISDRPLTIEEVARVRIYLQTIDDLCLEQIDRALATARKNWTHAREDADRYRAAEGVEIAVFNRIKRASLQPTSGHQATLLKQCVLEELPTRYALFDDAISEQIDEYHSAMITLEKLRHVYVTLYPEAQLSPRAARADLEASPTRRRCLPVGLPTGLPTTISTISSTSPNTSCVSSCASSPSVATPPPAAMEKSRSSPSLFPRKSPRTSISTSINLFQSPHRRATKS
jgi:hypothetical protein